MPRPASGKTPKHPSQGEVHGSKGRETDPTAWVGSALEGKTPRGHRLPSWVSARGGTDSVGGTRLWSRAPSIALSGPIDDVNGKRASGLERGTAPHEE